MSEYSKTQYSDKSRTHARDLHEISLDLAMVKNGLLQTLIEKLRYEYNSTTILTYESVQNTA